MPSGRMVAYFGGVFVGCLVLLTACGQDRVRRYRVPKEAAPSAPMAMTGSGMEGAVPAPPKPVEGGSLKWTLPKGWTQESGGGMRFATLKAPISGRLDISVVVLPGLAGGELANVNRWRGQINLSPMDESALNAARSAVKTKVGAVSLFDFTSEGQSKSRMVAGLLNTPDGNTWFLKMTGDAEAVGKTKPDFLQWIGSLRLD